VFAAGWDAALAIAREKLADTLLARSIEGNVEQIWRDGVLVGERHVIDNRLGLAILRRLDRLAETGLSVNTRGGRSQSAPALHSQPIDWEQMVNALRTGDADDVAAALALFRGEGDEVDEVEGPPNSLVEGDNEEDGIDLSHRCWWDEREEVWFTDFPPPAGFTGYEEGEFGEMEYLRACTPEEVAVLEADEAADRAAERAEEESLRDEWFAMLRTELGLSETAMQPNCRTSLVTPAARSAGAAEQEYGYEASHRIACSPVDRNAGNGADHDHGDDNHDGAGEDDDAQGRATSSSGQIPEASYCASRPQGEGARQGVGDDDAQLDGLRHPGLEPEGRDDDGYGPG
jgi:hypothetical protein